MHDTLRMDHDRYATNLDVKEPARLDHFEPLVEQRRGINGDLSAHDPGGMLQGALDGDARKLGFRRGAKWATRGGKPKLAHRAGRFPIQALENGGMFAIDGEHTNALLPGLAH